MSGEGPGKITEQALFLFARRAAVVAMCGGYLLFLAFCLAQGAPIKSPSNTPMIILAFASLIIPKDSSPWTWLGRVCGGLLLTVGLFMQPPAVQKVTLALLAVGVTFYAMGYASRRWRFLRTAGVRLAINTALICIGVVAALYLISLLPASGFEWHDVFVTNWYVTVVILYLPLMALVWLGLSVRQRFKNGKKPDV